MKDKEQERLIAVAVKFEREKSVLLDALTKAVKRIQRLEEVLQRYADEFPKPNCASVVLTEDKEL